MPDQPVTVTNEVGLHARPAAAFCRSAARYGCDVKVIKDGNEANAKSMMSVLKLDVRRGDTITLKTDGEGAQEALSELVKLVREL